MSGHKEKILVVDDEASICQILQTRLEMPQLIVTARGSGYFFPRIISKKAGIAEKYD